MYPKFFHNYKLEIFSDGYASPKFIPHKIFLTEICVNEKRLITVEPRPKWPDLEREEEAIRQDSNRPTPICQAIMVARLPWLHRN